MDMSNNKNGGQILEDLSTSYWLSEALFTALELDLFEIIEKNGQEISVVTLASQLSCSCQALSRYLALLIELELLSGSSDSICLNDLSRTYLLKTSPLYQGDIIRWRQNMAADWQTLFDVLRCGKRTNFLEYDDEELENRRYQYIQAMDNVAQLKATECANLIKDFSGEILDVGCGSGAMSLSFMGRFPKCIATLLDIEQILPQTRKFVAKSPFNNQIIYHSANILEKDWHLDHSYDLIILSNILHAYSENEVSHILATAKQLLNEDGQLLIHDFFMEHNPVKARLSDINMLLNTYNGKVFSAHWVIEQLQSLSLFTSDLVPLKTDTAVILASRKEIKNTVVSD
ncbi:class I SAM-dependent methyltransferase [Eubacteriaceae bacterium ES2]|nr:class I SAM-dependent methyltransferase [Eubacteriaceae bacterium ES2]